MFTRLYSWVADKNAGIDITSSRMDADTNDIVVGLEDCITLDGQNTPTHSLPMGGFTHTGVGNATARNNYAAAGQVVDGSLLWGGTSGGSANAQTIAITPTVTSLVAGQSFRFIAGFTNTAASTLTVNATSATAIRKPASSGPVVLVGHEIFVGNTYQVTFDGTYFVLGVPSVFGAGATLQVTPSNPASVTNATQRMAGLGADTAGGGASPAVITPLYSTRVLATIRGDILVGTASATGTTQMRYGTGAAPANGAAATGTTVGAGQTLDTNTTTNNFNFPMSVTGIITGLTPGTQIWLDLGIAATSGAIGMSNMSITATEI